MVVIRLIRALGRLILWLNFMFPTKGHIVSSGRQTVIETLFWSCFTVWELSLFYPYSLVISLLGMIITKPQLMFKNNPLQLALATMIRTVVLRKVRFYLEESTNIQRKKETKERISFAVRYFETVFSHSNLP